MKMSSCILCLKPTKRSKITLNELIIDKTVKEVIIEQFSNHELILTGSSSASQAICPTCCKHFKDFYNFKKDINQKLSEVAVKVEEVPVDFVNFVLIEEPVLDYDLKQLEINIERVKTEPKDVEEYLKEFKEDQDSDFEWKVDKDKDWMPSDDETLQKVTKKRRKRKASDDDSDFDLPTERKRSKETYKPRKIPKYDDDDERIKKFCDLKCHICNTPMNTHVELRTHFKLNHPKEKLYLICCGKKFTRRNRLMHHINRHDNARSVPCKICDKTFVSIDSLRVHVKFTHEGHKKPKKNLETFVCNACGKKVVGAYFFKRHMMTHEEDERTFECYKCHAIKKNENLLKLHFHDFHNPLKKKMQKTCEICSKTVSRLNFSSHMKTHSNVPQDKLQCSICDHWIKRKGMHDHMKSHKDPDVTCDECGKVLKPNSMFIHKRLVHGEPGKFQCTLCDKRYHQEQRLKEHVAVVHTREILYQCRVEGCGRGFRNSHVWKKHERNVHPEEYEKLFKPFFKRDPNEKVPDVPERPINSEIKDEGIDCEICGKYIRKSSWLDKHKRDFHSGREPRFSCTYCDAKFHIEKKWREHTAAQHTKEFLYFCRVPGCGRGFRATHNWKYHEKRMHPGEIEKILKKTNLEEIPMELEDDFL